MKSREDSSVEIPLEYLLECSKSSLNSFLLAQLNKSANSRKELKEIMSEWIEARALALLAEWLMNHGEELMALASKPPESQEKQESFDERTVEPKRKNEFWRSEPGFRKARRA